MPTEINLFTKPAERVAQNRAALQQKAQAKLQGTYKEPPSNQAAWKAATQGAEVRAHGTSAALEENLKNPDASLQTRLSQSIKTPSGGRAAGALTKEPMPDQDFQDLGESNPGASKAQGLRGRAIAKSMRENASSVGDNMSHEAPVETDLHAGNKPWVPHTERGTAVATGSGENAGAMMGVKEMPKDLGRVTAKVVRGDYGELSPKTMSAVKGGFLGRAAESVAGKIGGALGMYGTASLAAKAVSALHGMREGKVVDPLTLDTHKPQEGEEIMTIRGRQKYTAPKQGDPGYQVES